MCIGVQPIAGLCNAGFGVVVDPRFILYLTVIVGLAGYMVGASDT